MSATLISLVKDLPLTVINSIFRVNKDLDRNALTKNSRAFRLTPPVIFDESLIQQLDPEMESSISQTLSGVYSAHYLLAVQSMAKVGDVFTADLLDEFATHRDTTRNIAGHVLESHTDYSLPSYGVVVEDNKEPLSAHTNLAVGRMIDVKLYSNGQETTVKVMVNISPMLAPQNAIVEAVHQANVDMSFISRYHKYKAGEIATMADFLLGLDNIRRDRKALLDDKTGVYTALRDKTINNAVNGLATGRHHKNAAATMMVLSRDTADKMEAELGGSLANYRIREKLFADTMSFAIMVVDARKERVRLYVNNIEDASSLTYRDIKNFSKSANSLDVGALMKAFQMGNML